MPASSKLPLLLTLGVEAAPHDPFAHPSASREGKRIVGHVAAAFTPFTYPDAEHLDLGKIPLLLRRFKSWGVRNVMVCGTTGEGVSMSAREREDVVRAWSRYLSEEGADKDIALYVHVGMQSVYEAAEHARRVTSREVDINGLVRGIFAMAPNFYKPPTVEAVVNSMAPIAAANPGLPFWYYHIPELTGIEINQFKLVEAVESSAKIPNFMGVKFTDYSLMEVNSIANYLDGKYEILFGRDEILAQALSITAVKAAVGSTVNYLKFNLGIFSVFEAEKPDLAKAEAMQMKIVEVVRSWSDPDAVGAQNVGVANVGKDILRMTGIDFGPLRWPQIGLDPAGYRSLRGVLRSLGVDLVPEPEAPGSPSLLG